MKQTYNSFRVSYFYAEDENNFSDLRDFVDKNKDYIEQIAFFTTKFHPPMPLDTAKKHCDVLKERIKSIKELGVSCGVNILATVGHHPQLLSQTLKGNWEYMTNIDGEKCLGSRCMNSQSYLEEYVRPLYELHCKASPDFIWIDDDIRYGHFPIGYGCFCDNCIEKFNRDFSHNFDRESLKVVLNSDKNVVLRKEWLLSQGDKIVKLLTFIRKVVSGINPSIKLGLMTGERYFEGYDFKRWADALSDNGKHEIMWRPGGGAYTDYSIWDQIDKASEIGRQVALLPDYVKDIQSELENFPYQIIKKSPRATALEAILHISSGVSGTAFNILPDCATGENISLIEGHMAEIRKSTPFMKVLSNTLKRSKTVGIHSGWNKNSQAAVSGNYFNGGGEKFSHYTQELFALGLPECYDFDYACAFTLFGRAPYAFDDKELKYMLSKGIYMNFEAAQSLIDMGYGQYIGATVGEEASEDYSEQYTDNSLNRGFVGGSRVMYDVFGKGESRFLSCGKDTEVIANLSDKKSVKACMTLFTNELGGKVCVGSYRAFSHISDSQKSMQLKRLFYLLSDGKMPYVESYMRIRLICRRIENGLALILFNMNMDELSGISVVIDREYLSAKLIGEDCEIKTLTINKNGEGYPQIIVDKMQPMSVAMVVLSNE